MMEAPSNEKDLEKRNTDDDSQEPSFPSQNPSAAREVNHPPLQKISTFKKLMSEKEVVSRSVISPEPVLKPGINLPVIGRVEWAELKVQSLLWLKSPLNILLLLWILGVTVSGAILFMVMVGMLNAAVPKKSDRNVWFEVSNQVINALFTLMCIILHPSRFRAAIRLYQWKKDDIIIMRLIYCKNGERKPNEWKHMLVVVTLLHLNCFFQYGLAALNWGFPRSERPAIGVGILFTGAMGCAAAAGLYNNLSPLGKDYKPAEEETDIEFTEAKLGKSKSNSGLFERSPSFFIADKTVEHPEWKGSLFDCFSDYRVCILSFLFPICIFGINADRLGLGNKFIHMVTFALFMTAPFLVFNLAAINIDNNVIRLTISITGIVISALGIMYGGYWRMKMRQTYGLPSSRWGCNSRTVTDVLTWLFCPCCALSQEVRTAESYIIQEGIFVEKAMNGDGKDEMVMDAPPPAMNMSNESSENNV